MIASAKKLFVLDTNVLLHDPNSIFHFQEHDVVVPIVVIEEVDHFKKDQTEVGRNARTVSRLFFFRFRRLRSRPEDRAHLIQIERRQRVRLIRRAWIRED